MGISFFVVFELLNMGRQSPTTLPAAYHCTFVGDGLRALPPKGGYRIRPYRAKQLFLVLCADCNEIGPVFAIVITRNTGCFSFGQVH